MRKQRGALMCALLLLGAAEAAVGQTRKVVMVHGARATGATWAAGAASLQASVPGLPPVQRPTINQSVSLFAQGTLLRDSVLLNMPTNQNVLVAHSNGGLMSRHASPFLSPLGIVTVGTGHAGVPIATQVGAIVQVLQLNTFFLLDVLSLSAYQTAFGYMGFGPVQILQMSALSAALVTEIAYVYGLSEIESLNPFLADNVPGSAFVQQLPTGGPNRYSISVSDASGAAPWSLALSPTAAQNAM